jgi:hypothetical protein
MSLTGLFEVIEGDQGQVCIALGDTILQPSYSIVACTIDAVFCPTSRVKTD